MSDFWNSALLNAFATPSEQENEEARKRYRLLGIEQPGVLAKIGRGFTDVFEPVKQLYLNAYPPDAAAAYQQQRASDEALYQRGLLAETPQLASPDPLSANSLTLPGTDPWRVLGEPRWRRHLPPAVCLAAWQRSGRHKCGTTPQRR